MAWEGGSEGNNGSCHVKGKEEDVKLSDKEVKVNAWYSQAPLNHHAPKKEWYFFYIGTQNLWRVSWF